MGQSHRHFRNIPCPGGQQRRTFIDLVGNDLIESICLVVMRLAVMCRLL